MKLQPQTTTRETPNPNPKPLANGNFLVLDLEILWSLELGAWSFQWV